ncbi:MAG: Rid family detoxifying hydrolase [Actinomycetota bacterium]|nr:Rid family detoxifying hydrolase [Actinomycetota bacterium]
MPKQIHDAPSGPKPLGPYSVITEAHGLVFVSGMIAIDPATGAAVDGGVSPQTEQVMRNIGAVLGDVGLSYDDIVKTTIFVTDMNDFAIVNAVYADYVGEAKPARSTVEVSALPGGFVVEIETIAAR